MLADAIARLAGLPEADARTDAMILLAHVLNVDRAQLATVNAPLTGQQIDQFNTYVNARLNHQPIAQIIGRRAFWKHDFIVTPDVLDPRADTETLIEHALTRRASRVLDLGTGTGCILLTLLDEWPAATGLGVDISAPALAVAKRNADNLGLRERAHFRRSNWFDEVTEQFDLIVSNPPYISETELQTLSPEVTDWEPLLALSPGGDGLDAYRIIAQNASEYLSDDGRLMLEIGWTQADSVSEILTQFGWKIAGLHKDLGGNNRAIEAVL